LLEKNNTSQWSEECNDAFQECKSLLTSKAVLVHYDVTRQLKLSCDTFQYGLGVVLSHVFNGEEWLIVFASHTLNKAKRNYGQKEKEP